MRGPGVGPATLRVYGHAALTERPGTAAPRGRIPALGSNGQFDEHRFYVKRLFELNAPIDVADGMLSVPLEAVGRLQSFSTPDRGELAGKVVDAVLKFGAGESVYRAFIGTERPYAAAPAAAGLTSTLCQQAHFGLDQYRYWAAALKERPTFQRKQWEFVFIAQALHERGLIAPGKRGLVFGAGTEQLPAVFASFGVEVLASDQAAESAVGGGWSASGQHTYDITALNTRAICTDRMFRELVSFEAVDMNDIPPALDGAFDFCWSACALEHLGSIEHGLRFIERSLATLRPGGVAVHTTEYNLSSDTDTIDSQHLCLFRRQDIDRVVDRLTAAGHRVAPIDWELGTGYAETTIDLPPFVRGEPHLRLRAGSFDTTSIGLIITRGN